MTVSPYRRKDGRLQSAPSAISVQSVWAAGRRMLTVQVFRYFLVGSFAALLHLVLFLTFMELVGLYPLLASTSSLAISICFNYMLQRVITFRSNGRHVVAGPRFIAVTLGTMTSNAALFGLLLSILPALAAQIVTLAMIFPVNYYLNKTITFRSGQAVAGNRCRSLIVRDPG